MLRYADSLSATAATFTPDLRYESDRTAVQLTGTFSQFQSGGWSAQGTTSGSYFSGRRRGLLGELAGLAGGSTHQDATHTGQVIANARVHAMRSAAGLYAGIGAGSTWDGSDWRRLLMAEAGGWMQRGPAMALLTITPVQVNESVRYVDAQATLSHDAGRVDLSMLAGARAGSQNPSVDTRTRAWGSLSAVTWVAARLAVVASGGSYPVDPTQGFPGGRFASLSVRFATSARRPVVLPGPEVLPEAQTSPPPAATGGVESFTVDRQTPGTAVFRITAPAVQLVEITGDFSGWSPVRLQPAGEGVWTASLRLAPGQYQMNLRVDGGTWLVPPGLLPLKDEFGGSVGLLILE